MELMSSTGHAVEVSSNGILIRNSSNHLLDEGPSLEDPSERLPDDIPNEPLSEEISSKCLIEAPSLSEEMPVESLSEDETNKSQPEEVPSYSLAAESVSPPEVPNKSFSEEAQTKSVTEVSGNVVVVEETFSWNLSQRTVNSSFKTPSTELLLNGSEEPDATRESVHAPDVVEEDVAKVQTNGWKPEACDTSILLPPWNRARVLGPAIAIFDMRGVDSLNYSKAEKLLRCKLAASYRLIDMFGWTDGVNASVSTLTNSGDVLVSPLGILHHEVTSSGVVKVNLEGDIIDPGSTGLTVDTNDLTLHTTIYRARPDIRCIMRFSSPIVVSFSALKCGLLPLCPEAMELGDITYTDYFGAICTAEDESLLGLVQHQNSKVMFLRNFGVVVCGDSVEQSFDVAYKVHVAIETQFKILHVGLANFHIPSEEKQRAVLETTSESPPDVHPSRIDRRLEDVRFEGLIRMLDGAGYQTGYKYRFPVAAKRTARSQSLMEVTHSTKSSASDASRVHDESLPSDPSRSVTPSSRRPASVMNSKSVIENSQGCRISHQFVPLGTDVREYKQKVKEIRKEFLPRHASAGPHSTVLEGVTWDEARRIQESQSNGRGGGGGGIKVTAASRGIIQRDHQKSALFYKEFTTGNPFDAVSKKELDAYVHDVHRKTATPVPPSTLPDVPELESAELTKQESTKEARQQERLNAEQERNKITTEPASLRLIAVDQTVKVESVHQTKKELHVATRQTSKDNLQPVVESSAFSEKQQNLNAGISAKEDTSRIDKFEQPVKPTVTVEQSPARQEKVESGKVETVSSGKEENSQWHGQAVPSPVAPAQVKQEERLAQAVAHSKSPESSQEASKSGRLQKSQSVMESDTNRDTLPKESGAEGVELRTKDKKKKRGLSAIFSKKKEK